MTPELIADDVLRYCENGVVPVNVLVDVAIEAHRRALKCPADAELVGSLAVRAIILAAARSVDDSRRQLDYLTALPASVWESAPAERGDILDAIRRRISWQMTD